MLLDLGHMLGFEWKTASHGFFFAFELALSRTIDDLDVELMVALSAHSLLHLVLLEAFALLESVVAGGHRALRLAVV